jgi:hypothetical protein
MQMLDIIAMEHAQKATRQIALVDVQVHQQLLHGKVMATATMVHTAYI